MPWYDIEHTYLKRNLDVYDNSEEKEPGFSGSVFLGYHLGNLGIQVEALSAYDHVTYKYWNYSSYNEEKIRLKGWSLLIPLIVKYDLNLGSFAISPLIGPYFNMTLGDLDGKIEGYNGSDGGHTSWANPPLGLMFGTDFGWKFRTGMLFLDARFAWDLGRTVAAVRGYEEPLWR
jgi:hypothetical protein